MQLTFTAPLWLWHSAKPGAASWHFITVPVEEAGLIRMAVPRRAGFGSVRIKARIGETSWATSIFPDAKAGTFLLPIKAEVRKREALTVGEDAKVTLTLDV